MNRKYHMSDDALLEWGSVVQGHLQNDLPVFTAFDEDLGQERTDALKTIHEEAMKEGGDDLNVAKLGEKTEAVNREMNDCRTLFAEIRYFVLKAFKSKAIQRQFGVGRFRHARDNQTKMISFFNELAETTAQYRDQLLAAKAKPELLDKVAAQAKALEEANRAQELKKGTRGVDTESRINLYNNLYDELQAFNAAAEYIFAAEPAKRDLYRPPSGSNSADAETEE